MEQSVDLPEDIISQIITSSGLDLKSAIKCMGVCKKWRNVVSDLISNNSLVPKGQFLVYNNSHRGGRFGALDDETNQIAWMYGQPPLPIRFQPFTWSCNGLVCLLSDCSKVIYICNPLIGEYISIPGPHGYGDDACIYQCNLGFCSSSNEYKLICVTRRCTLDIYTLGIPAGWRSVTFARKFWIRRRAAACVDGVFHWLLDTQSIFTFDLATEVLGTIPPPRLDVGKKIYQLERMDHCLVVTAGYDAPSSMEIWARKEDKSSGESVWTKNWVIDVVPPLIQVDFYHLVPRKLSTHGLIIMRDLHKNLYSYDSRDKFARNHWNGGWSGALLCSFYTATLISPKMLMQNDG